MTSRAVAAVVVAALVSGCAVAPVARQDYSLVDPRGVDMERYQVDYAECAQLANQASVEGNAAAGAVVGAGVGAVFGALLGAVICGRWCAQQGAAIGAVSGGSSGGVRGAAAGAVDQQATLRNCLTGRGYNVIR